MTYAETFPGNFIEAAHIPEGKEFKLTIKSIAPKGTVKFDNGKMNADRPVVYFEETNKGWCVGKTQAKRMTLMLGDMPKWPGQQVTLMRGLVKHPGAVELPVVMKGRLKMTYGVIVKVDAQQMED